MKRAVQTTILPKDPQVIDYRKFQKEYKEFTVPHSPEFWKSIGYLAKHSTLIIHSVRDNHQVEFEEHYSEIKGKCVGVKYFIQKDPKHWGIELRIKIKDNPPGWKLNVGNRQFDEDKEIRSNEIVWWLIGIGFDWGSDHNLEEIRSNVPETYRDSFDSGCSSGQLTFI